MSQSKFKLPATVHTQLHSTGYDSEKETFIADGAKVMGDVRMGNQSSVWYNAVLRGDINHITLGEGSNIQDGSVVHVGNDHPCVIGDYVTVGHHVNLHGCTVEDRCLIGIGAIVLNGAVIGQGSVIAAGAVVKEGAIVPPHSLMAGVPAKCIKTLPNTSTQDNDGWAQKYIGLAQAHR